MLFVQLKTTQLQAAHDKVCLALYEIAGDYRSCRTWSNVIPELPAACIVKHRHGASISDIAQVRHLEKQDK